MRTPLFLSAKRAERIETPEMSDRDALPHFGHRVRGASIPRDCRRACRRSVRCEQRSARSSQVVDGDHAAVRSASISGNQTRCASPEGIRSLSPPDEKADSMAAYHRPLPRETPARCGVPVRAPDGFALTGRAAPRGASWPKPMRKSAVPVAGMSFTYPVGCAPIATASGSGTTTSPTPCVGRVPARTTGVPDRRPRARPVLVPATSRGSKVATRAINPLMERPWSSVYARAVGASSRLRSGRSTRGSGATARPSATPRDGRCPDS
jgi:hypothetical protein